MKLLELNSRRVEISFSWKPTIKKKWLEFISPLRLNYIYWGGGGGGGVPATPTVQLNSIFSAKTDPRENPEKNPDKLFD
jgi:hypothetical protein